MVKVLDEIAVIGISNLDQAQSIANSFTAGEGGCRAFQVVYLDSYGEILPADSRDSSMAGKVVGLARSLITSGDEGLIQSAGQIENVAWDLDPGATNYVGIGEITAIKPSSGFLQSIGIAIDSKTLLINLGLVIIL